jgi:pilus assembly protein CpaD
MARSRVFFLVVLLILAACGEPVQQDYTKRFPIGARSETVHLTLGADGGNADASFRTLVAGYLDRGHGPLTLSLTAATPPAREAALRHRLVAAGIPASAIRIDHGGRGAAMLSYTRYDVILPRCGDWSTPAGYNPANTDYPALGCSVQRNLGLMLADPADIDGPRATEPTDAVNATRVIRAYRSGAATEAKQNAIQDAADQSVATGSTTGQSTAVPASSH